MFMYFSEVLEERRQAPSEDLISLLARSSEEGTTSRRKKSSCFACCCSLLAMETTTNLIANGAQALFARPELWREQKDTFPPPAAVGGFALMRPYRALPRHHERSRVAWEEAPRRVPLMVLFGSANRDPRHYPSYGGVSPGSQRHRSL